MSSHPDAEMIHARQLASAARAPQTRGIAGPRAVVGRTRSGVWSRVGRTVAAVGVCLGATAAVAINAANAHPRPGKALRHITAQQLAREISALESEGYVPSSCTVDGTRLRDFRTGEYVTISW